MKKLTLPLSKEQIKTLKAGETVYLSGNIYTARDCAHKRIKEYLDKGLPLPFELKGATIYYAGPCPAKPGMACGSCGPTTSARMNSFAPLLFDNGLNCVVGKGEMNDEVISSIKKNACVYFAAIGGAGALYGKCIKKCELVAFGDLMSEAVYALQIEDFPAVVAIDCEGNSIYK